MAIGAMDLRTLSAIIGFLALNSALNMSNRWSLGISGFNCPLLLTCAHQVRQAGEIA